jgi:hypothetical protein
MRRDDIANTRRLKHEVRCYNCQKPAEREVIKHYGEKPNEKYMGNLEIRKEIPVKDSDGKIRYNYELFTGMWIMKFGYFCSVKCGLIWACHTIQKRFEKKREIVNPLPPSETAKLMSIMDNIKKKF